MVHPASLLLGAAAILYLVALRLVLMVAMIGGCIEAAPVAGSRYGERSGCWM